MSGHVKKYTLFLLCTALLNAALCSPTGLIAQPKASSHDKTVQTAENHDLSNKTQSDDMQANDTQAKKPTRKESWRKLVTLKWKELGKADAWNIGAPITGIAALGLLAYYYNLKTIVANNVHHNPDHNNPGGGTGVPTGNDDSSSNSSDSDSSNEYDNPGDSNIPQPVQLLTPEKRKSIARLVTIDNEILIDDVQNKIALNMITDFLAEPIRLQGNIDGVKSHRAIAIDDNRVVIGSVQGTVRIWNIHNGALIHTLQAPFYEDTLHPTLTLYQGEMYDIKVVAIHNNKVITRSDNNTIRTWDINNSQLLNTEPQDHVHVKVVEKEKIHKSNVTRNKINDQTLFTLEIRDINNDQLLRTFVAEDPNWLLSAKISNQVMVMVSDDKTARVWPLHVQELKNPDHDAPSWIKCNLLPMQANLIARLRHETQSGNPFIITIDTDDAHIWITFPAHVRDYLMGHLNIQLKR